MNIIYPHVIENCIGEKLIFQQLLPEPDGDRLLVENYVTPGSGPVMHTHWLQDEALTVLKGKLGYEVLGEGKKYAGEGDTVLFKRGTPHRFWNEGQEILHCKGWLKPANTIVFFLSSIYAAQNKSGKAQPEPFDAAFLMTRYASEYDLPEVPTFVKKTVIPLTFTIGKLLGKYKHFKDAPDPIKPIEDSDRLH
jgi:quercetin dioxygenase-like cupin family protein